MSTPTATFEAPPRRDPTPNLDDPRVPKAVRQIACAARVVGHTVEVFESFGNALKAKQLHVKVWAPWDSDLGTALRKEHAAQTANDEFHSAVEAARKRPGTTAAGGVALLLVSLLGDLVDVRELGSMAAFGVGGAVALVDRARGA